MPKNGVNTCPQFRSNISFCSEICSNHDCLSDPIFEQCSNYSSYFVRAVHQFPIMPLRANTINISLQPFHLLLRRHPSLVLFPPLSLFKNTSVPPSSRFKPCVSLGIEVPSFHGTKDSPFRSKWLPFLKFHR